MVHQASKLQMKLSESKFPFSKRMLNFFQKVELSTIGELATIPLEDFIYFRGFKTKCKEELIKFIEFEELQSFFIDFNIYKNDNLNTLYFKPKND